MVKNNRVIADADGLKIQVVLRGDGPLLLLYPGATGMPVGYAALIRLLSQKYTLATYDRRGHGRSAAATGEKPDGANKPGEPAGPGEPGAQDRSGGLDMARHARDAAAVVDAIGAGPAHVVGSSSGAVIGLELLSRFPDRVGTLIAHEPPLVSLVDDADRWHRWYADLVEINEKVGTRAAFDYFFAHLLSDGSGEQDRIDVPDSQFPEWDVYLAREVMPIITYRPDEAALAAAGGRVVPLLGADSRERWHGRVVSELASRLGTAAVEVPGGHLAPVYRPAEFRDMVEKVLPG
jgi:pimeloyl-ACP methyl ester carboxylesterase